MWKALTIGTILLLVAGLLGVGRLAWRSPDYAATGMCSATDIDNTYAALSSLRDGFHEAAARRASFEFWTFQPHRQNLNSHLATTLNQGMFQYLGKRQTAAFLCSHTTHYFDGRRPPRSVPETVAILRPYATTSPELWELATCAAMREPYVPHEADADRVERLQTLCRTSVGH